MKKILITGATGLIGSSIVKALINEGSKVVVTSRDITTSKEIFGNAVEHLQWDAKGLLTDADTLHSVTAVIHLLGASVVGKRWSVAYKNEIMLSRVRSTAALRESFARINYAPSAFICSSATGYYGSRHDEKLTESSGSGDGFLADVCKAWEDEAAQFTKLGSRVVQVRTGIVLDKLSGALPKMMQPFQFFAQVIPGSGRQWFSWIHILDIVGIYLYAINNTISGVVNAVAPEPVTMAEFMLKASTVKRSFLTLNIPEPLLRIILGEASFEILKSQRVYPEALLKDGYTFAYPKLQTALLNLLK